MFKESKKHYAEMVVEKDNSVRGLRKVNGPWAQSVAYAGKDFGGFKVMVGLVGSPGAEPPGHRRIFENLQKIS